MPPPPVEHAPGLTAKGIRHGFFGRRASPAGDSGFNVSPSFGTPQSVAANYRTAAAAIGTPDATVATVKQIHSAQVVTLLGTPDPDERAEADALVTDIPGIALAIITADCAPILFADPEARVIGACHAGWRGAVSGIAGQTVRAMTELGADPSRIAAAMGPAISGANYEVGPAFAAEVMAINPDAKPHIFVPEGATREHFDLPGFLRADLARLGLAQIESVGTCTYADAARYFSHRRSTHTGEPEGRQAALIAL